MIELNRNILVIFVALIASTMMATPVFAMGPVNAAGKNPNVVLGIVPGVSLLPPSELDIDWVLTGVPVPTHIVWKDARYFKINNAFIVTDAHQALVMQNTWLFLTKQMFYDLMILHNVSPSGAAYLASFVPEGTYMKSVQIGK